MKGIEINENNIESLEFIIKIVLSNLKFMEYEACSGYFRSEVLHHDKLSSIEYLNRGKLQIKENDYEDAITNFKRSVDSICDESLIDLGLMQMIKKKRLSTGKKLKFFSKLDLIKISSFEKICKIRNEVEHEHKRIEKDDKLLLYYDLIFNLIQILNMVTTDILNKTEIDWTFKDYNFNVQYDIEVAMIKISYWMTSDLWSSRILRKVFIFDLKNKELFIIAFRFFYAINVWSRDNSIKSLEKS